MQEEAIPLLQFTPSTEFDEGDMSYESGPNDVELEVQRHGSMQDPEAIVPLDSRRSFTRTDNGVDDTKAMKESDRFVIMSQCEYEGGEEKGGSPSVVRKTPAMRRTERMQLFSLSFTLFLAGWDGATQGPLIPRLQAFYDVNYAVVSLIFIMNAIGFLLGASMNMQLTDKFGLGKVLVVGSIGQMVAYILMVPALPFPVFCFAFLLDGWGLSLQDGLSNSFVAGLAENASAKMGIMHAVYGLGAICSPFAATQFAQMPRHWSYHFTISLSLSVVNTLLLLVVFKGGTQDECYAEIGEGPTAQGTSEASKYKQVLSQKVVHLLAFFSLFYVGIEFTIAGWTVSYIQKYRGGGAASGYISTGFFGGLTIGRVALLWVNEKIGEHLIIYIYTLLALGLELVAWLVPILIVDAVAVSLAGVVLGPMYPILMNETGRLVPQWLHTGSIAWIASFGFAGQALFPFITGALAEKFGIVSLQPLLVILLAILFVLWLLVPDESKRGGRCPGEGVPRKSGE